MLIIDAARHHGTARAQRGRMDPSRGARCSVLSVVVASFAVLGCVGAPQDTLGSASQALDPGAFVLPPSDAQSRAQILSGYWQLDPTGVVPRGLLEDAIEYFDLNKALIQNQAFITVVDFTKFSGDKRFFIVDMKSGVVEPHMVAHGEGSDPNDTGYAKKFSNTSGSLMSSLGFYLTAEIYDGTHPHSMHINGLSPDGSPNMMADTNVLSRAVVVHEATYVSDTNTNAQGRSDGCFALDTNIELGVVDRLAMGSLMYAELAPLNPPIGRSPSPPPADLGTSNPGGDGGSSDGGGDTGGGGDMGGGDTGGGGKGDQPPDPNLGPSGARAPHGGCSAAGGGDPSPTVWLWFVIAIGIGFRVRSRRARTVADECAQKGTADPATRASSSRNG